jgi:hypothetical protein
MAFDFGMDKGKVKEVKKERRIVPFLSFNS